ncbi:MAG: hypothetical protein F4Z02_09505 [Acidimicrobiia bacterium]|nr:hypothetical protein [Acidimicrobiia bacterium]MYG71982.1 hypothetical protein [Acidimicrobiia bacterium]
MYNFDPDLTDTGTPDWYLYLRAAEAGFDALVTRDKSQAEQPEEMWVLSQTEISVVTWRRPVNDPVLLWGQLVAYLPEIHRLLHDRKSSMLFLPVPRLNRDNLKDPASTLGIRAKQQGVSNQQIRDQARMIVATELRRRGEQQRFLKLKAD